MKRLFPCLIASFLLFISMSTCFGEGANEKFQFAEDYIRCLQLLESGFVDAKAANTATYDNEISKGIGIMKSVELQNNNLNMAKKYLSRYQNSSDKLIVDTVKAALSSFDGQIDINNAAKEGYKKMYSPEVLNNPSQFNLGEEMAKISKLQAAKEESLILLIQATKLLTGVLVSKTPGDEGKMNYLAITLEQKEEILKQVKEIFGDKIETADIRDKNSGLETFDLCGVVLYKTLSQSYKTIDMRPKGFVENEL
jgi:hypothetical protein